MNYDTEIRKIVFPGKVCVLASRPGEGKSSLARKVAMIISKDSKVLIIDLDGNNTEKEVIENSNITYNNSLNNVDEIVDSIKNNDYSLVVIDYIQLLTSKQADLTKLKSISKMKNVCILAISQLPFSFNFNNILENQFVVNTKLYADLIAILRNHDNKPNLTIV